MEDHFLLSDSEFEKQFISGSLEPKLFSHEAHLRMAWLALKNLGMQEGEKFIETHLKNYVKAVGAEEKYNQTLTVAALKAVEHFMAKSKASEFKEFIAEFPRLKNNFRDLMSQHYSFDIYNSADAKQSFLKPDLMPFD